MNTLSHSYLADEKRKRFYRHLEKINRPEAVRASMSAIEFPASWKDPQYISTIIGVLATGALFFYTAIADSGPTTEEAIFVLFSVFVPMTIAYEIARRWL